MITNRAAWSKEFAASWPAKLNYTFTALLPLAAQLAVRKVLEAHARVY
jgi:hypothetical protein